MQHDRKKINNLIKLKIEKKKGKVPYFNMACCLTIVGSLLDENRYGAKRTGKILTD